MGLNAASVTRFRTFVDKVLCEMFPAMVLIENSRVESAGPGGRTVTTYMEGGESEEFRFPFRIPKSHAPVGWRPIHGVPFDWEISPEQILKLEVIQAHIHPYEDVWEVVARKRRVP